MKNKLFTLTIALLFLLPIISAAPGMPHWFYGDVTVNGASAPDNNIITASIDGDEYITVTKNGNYGSVPNRFYVEDPEDDRIGDTITFYVGGMQAETFIFENAGYTNLDFELTTTCGDGYCLGDETCSSCSNDCGICTDPPIITIVSPVNQVYDITSIDLDVLSDQNILIWMYALNSADPITFNPNITLTLDEGYHDITVIGINSNYQSGSSTVLFTIDIPEPFCGDGTCDADESCSLCPTDCGSCSGGSSGGGSSGGGSGGSSSGSGTTPINNEITTLSFEQEPKQTTETEKTLPEEISEEKSLFSKITGAVVGVGNQLGKSTMVIGFLALIFIAVLIISFVKKRKVKAE
ncbi:MAG: hypothetical protein KKF48_02325 [Nanoarchaeota archaeon]|nr:hypothetical protein [Nanoarchaeota archaeon]MBU1027856.1 hypothetical protein [Nanoarchaeota archaeon]